MKTRNQVLTDYFSGKHDPSVEFNPVTCAQVHRATKEKAVYRDPLPPSIEIVDSLCPAGYNGDHKCIAPLRHARRHLCRCGLTWGMNGEGESNQ